MPVVCFVRLFSAGANIQGANVKEIKKLVPEVGLEPTRVISPADFESAVSTDFTTLAMSAGKEPCCVEAAHYINRICKINTIRALLALGV